MWQFIVHKSWFSVSADDGYNISSYDDVAYVEIKQSGVQYIARLFTLILGMLYGLLGIRERMQGVMTWKMLI